MKKRYRGVLLNPTRVIEIILAAMSGIISLVIVSPFYIAMPGTIQYEANSGFTVITLVMAVILGLAGFLNLLANWFNSPVWRKWTIFAVALSSFFMVALRLVLIGFFPLSWTWRLAFALIAMVCHMSVDSEYEEMVYLLDSRRRK